jgi:hypothetical protein
MNEINYFYFLLYNGNVTMIRHLVDNLHVQKKFII